MSERFAVAAALDGAGWHPAAWRADSARPGELFTAQPVHEVAPLLAVGVGLGLRRLE